MILVRTISTKIFAPRRQDRKENFFDPPPWRPLRLCESHRLSELNSRGISVSFILAERGNARQNGTTDRRATKQRFEF